MADWSSYGKNNFLIILSGLNGYKVQGVVVATPFFVTLSVQVKEKSL